MSAGFLLINAIFFGMLTLIFTLQFFFKDTGVPYQIVPVWLAGFVWTAYCITQLLGV
jgi:hypothetical protein